MAAVAFDLLIVASVAAALWARHPTATDEPRSGRLGRPEVWLAVVTLLLFANQVLVTVYVLRVHQGDVGFIQRYLGPDWFHLDRSAVLTEMAAHVPAPELLAPSILRIPALLELPFVVLAYLTVSRWFGAEVAARRLVWPASVSYSVTLGLVEWHLHNPYTWQDLALRAVAACAVPLLVHRLAPPPRSEPLGPLALICATVSAAALGWLVLATYETALLYNLGDLATHLPGIAAAAAVLTVARLVAARVPNRAPGVGVDAIGTTMSAFLVAFFVPALPIRYGISFASPTLTVTAAVVIVVVAVVAGLREVRRRRGAHLRHALLLPGMAGAGACGIVLLVTPGYPEQRLLAAATAGLIAAIAAGAPSDKISNKH